MASPSLYFLYTLPPPPWRVLILPRQTEKEKREREIRKLVRKGTSAYITALANAVHTHNGVSSYTQSPYISQEVNASCMYRVEAYILYYTCCCLSLICWEERRSGGETTQLEELHMLLLLLLLLTSASAST